MAKQSPDWTKTIVYQAPTIYVGLFYLCIVVWTIIAFTFLGSKEWASWMQFFMVAFILVMTWYFSLGISYKARISEDGKLELVSFRRLISIHSTRIVMVEGPYLPVGFIRFRLEREKAYLFGVVKNKDLQQILSIIRTTNPDVKFKSL